jgi:hypothetical protein
LREREIRMVSKEKEETEQGKDKEEEEKQKKMMKREEKIEGGRGTKTQMKQDCCII